MTNRAHIQIFIFLAKILNFGDSLGEWHLATNSKFLHNIFKRMPARPRKHSDMGCEYQYNSKYKPSFGHACLCLKLFFLWYVSTQTCRRNRIEFSKNTKQCF